MLDPKFIREHRDQVIKNTAERQMDAAVVDEWLKVDSHRLDLLKQVEEVRRQKNELATAGKQGTDVATLRERGQTLRTQEKELEQKLLEIDTSWHELIQQIPNLHLDSVPKGTSEADNVVLREVGVRPQFNFPVKDHLTLGEELGILDFESGAKVAGSQFYYLHGDSVMLEFALLQWGLQFLAAKGYRPVITPDMAKSRFYLGTGYAPRGDEAQTYEIADSDLGLIATAEVTMAGMFADHVFAASELPLKFAAVSHCFRKEGGSYGKYSKGMYRVHQFTKLEMFVYCLPEQSEKLHQELLQIEEEMTQALEIPYRVVEMNTADLGAMAARKFDLEAWMPGRGDYGEITSTSNTTDFQSRNLNIRFRGEDGKTEFAHLLNGTALALSRIPVAIMENFQQADGTIAVPKVLRPFMGKDALGKVN